MNKFWRLRGRTTAVLLERRWLVIVLLAAFVLLFELWENLRGQEPIDIHLLRELLFFGVIYPLVTFLLVNRLLDVQVERNHIALQQEHSRQLKQKLGQAKDVEAVYQTIVTFPESFAPVMGVVLFRPATGKVALEIVAERWPVYSERPSPLSTTIPYNFCGAALHLSDRGLHPFVSPHPVEEARLHGYCLPLFRGEVVVGLLHLYLPASKNLTADQIGILNQTSGAIVLALGTAVAPNVEDIQAAAASDERKRIARHLHDTLAQSLAYLQSNLTKLTTNDLLFDVSLIHQDLERMRDISNEAYEQVRQTMSAMQVESQQNVAEELVSQVKVTAQRAELGMHYVMEGQPHSLPPLAQRKILFIFREALNNVHRHAQATAVNLTITWDTDAMVINLRDNGIGFNTKNGLVKGHFGLLIMAQRAEEINADLVITSSPGKGTNVSLCYPYLDAISEFADVRPMGVNGNHQMFPE